MDNNYEEILIRIGKNIRQIRKRYGYTQTDLSEKLGVSLMTISRIENGNVAMNILLLLDILKLLNIEMNSLLL